MIGNGGDIFCVFNAHCIERYFEGLTAIYRYILNMLFERQCWSKSTSKNVAKAYLDIQLTANHYTLYYANNAWLHAYIIN
jgi:hypothetical protein